MCGIVGVVAERDCVEILMEGLRRLEYRGYDSAGLAAVGTLGELQVRRALGKVSTLQVELHANPVSGMTGIAHTRWATHGRPSVENAHPHSSDGIVVVHNGIIENYEVLRQELIAQSYQFLSETDTEVVGHLLSSYLRLGMAPMQAFPKMLARLRGAYALAIIIEQVPDKIFVARKGSPLVLGIGIGEHFVASDQLALRPVTDRFIFLQDGDFGAVSKDEIALFSEQHLPIDRPVQYLAEDSGDASKGTYRHYMLKEIFEQPHAVRRTIAHLLADGLTPNSFDHARSDLLAQTESIQIVACGTSYHSGMIAKYWIEELLHIPVMVEIASEFRYREAAMLPRCLFLTISQSGETADTLAALQKAEQHDYIATLAVCNVATSSLVRGSTLALLTKAGPEIGVASTKAFTTQLVALLILTGMLARARNNTDTLALIIDALKSLPELLEITLGLDKKLQKLSSDFALLNNALFLGRGCQYPVAMEGALKLKEISYIHAEAYAAGELKHGPLALVDEHMPVVAVAPSNDVLDKVKSNLEEVKARKGRLYVFADVEAGFSSSDRVTVINVPHSNAIVAPIVYSLPLQLLAYYAAIVKGTDVDQPRNLAKSVTVE